MRGTWIESAEWQKEQLQANLLDKDAEIKDRVKDLQHQIDFTQAKLSTSRNELILEARLSKVDYYANVLEQVCMEEKIMDKVKQKLDELSSGTEQGEK